MKLSFFRTLSVFLTLGILFTHLAYAEDEATRSSINSSQGSTEVQDSTNASENETDLNDEDMWNDDFFKKPSFPLPGSMMQQGQGQGMQKNPDQIQDQNKGMQQMRKPLPQKKPFMQQNQEGGNATEGVCTMEYVPVCAKLSDGTMHTFPNKCAATQKGAEIQSEEACEGDDTLPMQGQKEMMQKPFFQQNGNQMMQQNGMGKPQKPMMKPEEMLKKMNTEDPFSDDFMEGFMDDFDPFSFREFDEDQLQEIQPDFLNSFAEQNPEKLKRMDPRVFNMMGDNIDQIDPEVFNNMQQFGRSIDPKIFGNIKDKTFFQKFDPDFLNSTDVSEIPENVFENIDPTQFSEMDPELYERMQKVAPERLKMIPAKVRKATELMLDDIPEDILKEYGFEGESAEKVKKMMQAVNKQKRDQVMEAFDGMDEEVQNGMMDMQDEFTDDVGDFMDYLPFVPKKMQSQFAKYKKDVLEEAKRMTDMADSLEGTLGQDLSDEISNFTDDITSYNFTGDSADELQKMIDEFVGSVSTMSKKQVQEELKQLKEEMWQLRDDARQDKFTQGIIPFKDTDDNQWFTSFVSEAAKDGVIGGYKDAQGKSLGEFRPANKVTIAEALKMAVASSGLKESMSAPSLEQAKTHWVKGWIKTAEDNGMSVSVADVNASATRGDVVRWAIEAYGVVPPKAETSSFPDVSLTDKNVDYIEYAKSLGIISGDGDTGKFRPNDTIIRAEVAKILNATAEALATTSVSTN